VAAMEPDAFRERLDALSSRIERRIRELQERGAFSGVHGDGMKDIRKRSAAIQAKLDAAIARGDRWDMLKYELERDFHSLNEDFQAFERRLDASIMK
jgi:hypothetical protein